MELTSSQRRQLQQFAPDHLKAIEGMTSAPASKARAKPAVPSPDAFEVDISDLSDRLTVVEAEQIEEVSGLGLVELFANIAKARVTGMAALVWILRKRDDPKYTYKQAQAMTLSQLYGTIKAMRAEQEAENEPPFGANSGPPA